MDLKKYLDNHIFNEPNYTHLKKDYAVWYDFLINKIEFHIQSDLHGVNHCGRVLLYALILADRLKLNAEYKEILCHTAVFHDSKRFDDGYDIGHGKRGAEYYEKYCQINGLTFYQESYLASFYHDLNDEFGLKDIPKQADNPDKALLLFKLFKDADALDRYRLGLDGLDVRFLRIDESKQLTEFSKNLVLNTERFY